jgi:predicted transcriptional regulator
MTPAKANVLISAITSTLYDLRNDLIGGLAPASQIYLALGMDISAYNTISRILTELGLVRVTAETIALTPKGVELGRKCSEILEEAKAKRLAMADDLAKGV